jgi:hypothetical protein
MKHAIFLLLLAASVSCFSQKPVIKHVVTHNRTTIVCDPSVGTKSFPKWGVFPSEKDPVRKIIMHVSLGSPDSLLTAHWDYLDQIHILRTGGVKGSSLNYELGRMLTPYGSVFGKGWQWKWSVDVTDFAAFLRDSVEVEYIHSGYEDKTVGWALTIDFEIVSGPPVADMLGVTPLWVGRYKYGDPNDKIEDALLPYRFSQLPGSAIDRIRIQHTGHGNDTPAGCSEFCPRQRQIKMDSNIVDDRQMWKDCGANPLYPQGGTWIYDRAYWCPGDLQTPDIIDVPATPGEHSVTMIMQPYTATENIQAIENITAYLFQYSKPRQKTDVAIDEIIVPTTEQQYSRNNPACFNPQVVIRNLGSDNLRSVIITYGTTGFTSKKFQWNGNLKFNETADLIIPGVIDSKDGENTFTVSLSKPNGSKDGWSGDNEMTSEFIAPEHFPCDFIIQLKTNNKPEDNKVFIINSRSDTIYKRATHQPDTNITYSDTIHLGEGSHEMYLTDAAGDGLEFWAEPQNGDGYLRIFDIKGNLIHAFESDCGNGQKLSFKATSTFVTDTITPRYAFSLYPRLVKDITALNVVSNKTSEMTVLITVGGKLYERHDYTAVKNASYSYNLSCLPAGRIVIEVLMDGNSVFKGRVNKMGKRG